MSLKAAKSVMSLLDSKVLKDLGPMATIGTAMNVGFGVMTYKDAREEGYGKVGSIAKSVGEMIMIDAVGMPTYLGAMAVTGAPKLVVKGYEAATRYSRTMSRSSTNKPFQNATFNDNQQAFTMRQAGMQLAKASKYNLQNAMLGNEAQYLRY